MDTKIVCSKCGKTEILDNAKRAGWLIAQRAGQPEGYLIIRCNEHTTGHALKLAGLPQQSRSKRVENNIERGLFCDYSGHYTAVASEIETEDGFTYHLSYHDGEMPAFNAMTFDTLAALITEMRKTEPDLRKWKLIETE